MKKLAQNIVCLIGFMATIGSVNSQQLEFLDDAKVITVTGDNINLRKKPNVSAPKLINVCYPETDNCSLTWSNNKSIGQGLDVTPWQAHRGWKYLVAEETPEWYGIEISGFKAYINKKFAKEVAVTPITDTMLTQMQDYGYINQKPGITHGKYKGYALLCVSGYETEGYMVGKIINGFAVFDKHINISIYHSEDVQRIQKKANEWGGYSFAYGNQLAYDFCDGGCYLLDVNKMTDAELDRIFSLAEKDENYPTLIYANIGGSMVCIATVNE